MGPMTRWLVLALSLLGLALAQDWRLYESRSHTEAGPGPWRYTLSPKTKEAQELWRRLSEQYRDHLRAGYRVDLGGVAGVLPGRGALACAPLPQGGQPRLLHLRGPPRGEGAAGPLPPGARRPPRGGPWAGPGHGGKPHPKPPLPGGGGPGRLAPLPGGAFRVEALGGLEAVEVVAGLPQDEEGLLQGEALYGGFRGDGKAEASHGDPFPVHG